MRKKGYHHRVSVLFIYISFGFIILSGGASAAFAQSPPNLDGLVDNVYISHGYSIDYDGFYPQAKATLYVLDDASIDANYVWLAWLIVKDFNDNSYGANKHSSWGGIGHGFDDLTESDMQRLDLENTCGELVLDVGLDLLDGPGYATPSGYEATHNATEDTQLIYINGGDWGLMDFDTSLAANLNDHGYCVSGDCSGGGTDLLVDSPPWSDEPNYIPSATYSEWEYNLIWELRVDRSVFQTVACPAGTILGVATNPIELHASPSKLNESPVTLFKASSAIGDYIWLDADRDGEQDVTEPGIANVTVALYTDPNGDGNPADGAIIATTTTDFYGHYIFPDLGSGNYVVDVTDTNGVLTGYSLTTGSTDPHGPISLERNDEYMEADFGYAPSDPTRAAIGDFVWSDADNDGIQDPGEPGIGGVSLQLLADIDGDGNFTDVIAAATTAADGSYMFTNLDPGDYKVDVTDTGNVLSGYSLTSGPHSSPDPTIQINVEAGDVYLNADFGYYQAGLGTIGNQVFLDDDGDGLFESAAGEVGIDNVTVDLIKDINGNGVWDTGEPVISTVTASDGTYQFTGLPLDDGDGDADYLVRVTDLNDILRRYRKSIGPNPGQNNNSQAEPYAVALSAASPSDQTADFGYWFDQPDGLVGDRVWYDLDGDGLQDPGEPGIEGVTVELWSMKKQGGNWLEDAKMGEVTTDANGNYYFPNLPISKQGYRYRVKVITGSAPLAGLTPTNQPDNMDESEILDTDTIQVDLSLDFGYSYSGGSYSIGDYVWYDGDGDSEQDAGESGFENVTLALYEDTNNNGVIDDGEPLLANTTTDASGNYLFSGLPSGNYLVKVTDEYHILGGYTQTYGSDPQAVTISGASNLDVDFGYFRPSPTLAFISAFRAYNGGGQVVVHWHTASELGTVGFYLLRLDEASGEYKKIHTGLLPGLLNAPQGGIYRLVDTTAYYGGTYTYRLVEVEANGAERIFGPFTVTVGAPAIEDERLILEPMSDYYDKKAHPPSTARQARLQARQMALHRAGVLKQAKVGDAAKIAVREKGLVFVDASAIANVLGMPLNQVQQWIRNYNFRLTNRGSEVAYLAADGNAGLYFYGEDIDSIYTHDNIYRLDKKGKGVSMLSVSGGMPFAGDGSETFTDTLHLEEDRYALTALFDDPEADYWLWDFVNAGGAAKSFGFYAPGVADWGSATLTVTLKGATNTTANLDHHAKVKLNGTFIGEGRWDGTDAYQLTISFDQSLLLEGSNTIAVKGVLPGGVSYGAFYVDAFDVSYQRRYQAVNNRLLCRGNGSGVVTVEGFSEPGIMVFDVTDPLVPQLLTGTTIDGSFRVSFVPSSTDGVYLAVSVSGLSSPVSVLADRSSGLKDKQNAADYVAIVPTGLENALDDLVYLRQRRGLEVKVVELEDIYDEFNHGIASPLAIKSFLSYAYRNWRYNGPQYVVLVGKGTYDYKDNLGYGENLMPPKMMATPHGLFASDSYFGDVAGDDGVPEIAVGRLPVMTEVELQALIDKISNYEGSAGSWTGNALMLADNPDQGGNFPADSDYLANLLAGYTVDKVYLPDFADVNAARQQVINGFNSGAALVNYIGHAGLDRLATEGLLRSVDVSALQNGDKLPIMTAMTCVVARFEIPGYDTLSEALLLKGNGGAAAVWAPTGASLNYLAVKLAAGFFQAAFQGQETVLGKALLKTMADYAAAGGLRFMLNIYTLLGDPALEIK
jgi:hypothetical protein